MLERVALHQTRLRAPGLSIDARGVAMGTTGLLLLSSIERLVAFFAVFTESHTLDDLAGSLRAEVVKSQLGVRQIALLFRAESSDRMDVVAQVAALVSGHAFTGTMRHWVQYRDAGAPFGYDVGEIAPSAAAYVLYHQSYTQALDVEREIDLRALFLRLSPRVDPSAGRDGGARWALGEWGVGGALLGYLRRTGVEARVGVVESAPESALDDAPVRRFLFDLPSPPARILPLLVSTPGIGLFLPVAEGAAVEVGFRHPVQLRALPAFRGPSLVLFRGRGDAPVVIERVPAMGSIEAFARVQLLGEDAVRLATPTTTPVVRVPLRIVPSQRSFADAAATWVDTSELPLLRRLLYALGPDTLRRSTLAVTTRGAFVRAAPGTDVLPVGRYHRALHDALYVPAGFDVLPAVSPATLAAAVEAPAGSVVILRPEGGAWVIAASAFVSLESALVEGPRWAPLETLSLEAPADDVVELSLVVEDPGARPLRDVTAPKPTA